MVAILLAGCALALPSSKFEHLRNRRDAPYPPLAPESHYGPPLVNDVPVEPVVTFPYPPPQEPVQEYGPPPTEAPRTYLPPPPPPPVPRLPEVKLQAEKMKEKKLLNENLRLNCRSL